MANKRQTLKAHPRSSARDIVVAQLKGPLDELDALWDTLGLAHEARVESFDKYTKNFVTVLTNFIAETHEQLSRYVHAPLGDTYNSNLCDMLLRL